MKRSLDIFLSLIALIIFLPLGAIICLILKFSGEYEVFYSQPRIGKGMKTFNLLKFATMLKDSPNLASRDITVKNDPRILPIGGVLRKTKLNEVPQILNIIKGDMSLVGPRPLTPVNFSYYKKNVQKEISKLKPGLTGIGSIVFRDEENILARSKKSYISCYKTEIAPYKAALELWYSAKQSMPVDIKIIFLTAYAIFFPNSKLHFKVFKGLPRPLS